MREESDVQAERMEGGVTTSSIRIAVEIPDMKALAGSMAGVMTAAVPVAAERVAAVSVAAVSAARGRQRACGWPIEVSAASGAPAPASEANGADWLSSSDGGKLGVKCRGVPFACQSCIGESKALFGKRESFCVGGIGYLERVDCVLSTSDRALARS